MATPLAFSRAPTDAGSVESAAASYCSVMRSNAPPASSKNPIHDVAVNVGQTEVAAGIATGRALVIEAQEMQQRGVQVVDVDRVLDGPEAEFVDRAIDLPHRTLP